MPGHRSPKKPPSAASTEYGRRTWRGGLDGASSVPYPVIGPRRAYVLALPPSPVLPEEEEGPPVVYPSSYISDSLVYLDWSATAPVYDPQHWIYHNDDAQYFTLASSSGSNTGYFDMEFKRELSDDDALAVFTSPHMAVRARYTSGEERTCYLQAVLAEERGGWSFSTTGQLGELIEGEWRIPASWTTYQRPFLNWSEEDRDLAMSLYTSSAPGETTSLVLRMNMWWAVGSTAILDVGLMALVGEPLGVFPQ